MKTPQTRARKNLRFALRVMGLLARGFAVLFSLILALLLVAYFALPSIIDGDRVKAMLVAQLQQRLQRPVRIQSVILTPQGVKLTQFKILEAGGTASFIEGDFALVTVKLPALLERRLELENVRLASPRIHVTRDEQARWSFEDLFASTGPARSDGPARPFELPVSLAADRTSIESGRLEIDDKLRGTHFLIEKFNLSVKRFDLEAPFAYEVSFDNENTFGERKISASLALEGQMSLAGFDWARAFIRAHKAQLKLDGRTIKGSVSVAGFTAALVEADLALPALGAADWDWWLRKPLDLTLPPSRWKLKARLVEPRKIRVETLQASAAPFSGQASGLIDLSGPQPRLSAELSVEEFPLDEAASFLQAAERFDLRGVASGEASVTGWPGRLAVGKAHLRLRETEARFSHWRITKGDADISATEDFATLAVTLSSGALEAYNNAFGDITLSLKLVRKDLKVDYLSFKWDEARLRLRGRVVNLPEPRDVWVSGSLDQLHWERAQKLVSDVIASISTRAAISPQADDSSEPKRLWVRTFKYSMPKRFPDTIGHIRINRVLHKNFNFGDMDMLWDLRGVTNTLDAVNGEIRVGFGPGRVEDIQAVQDSNKFLRIVFLPYIYMHRMNSLSALSAAEAYPKQLDFNRIEGQYGVHRGVVDTRFCIVDSDQLIAYAVGSADFGRENVDMNILTRLTKYKNSLPEWWVDEKGRPAIGFRVKGDLNRPDLEPRLHKIGADEIENAMDDGRRVAKARFDALNKLSQLEGSIKGAKE